MNSDIDYLYILGVKTEKYPREYTDKQWAKAVCREWNLHDQLIYDKVPREWETITAGTRTKRFLYK